MSPFVCIALVLVLVAVVHGQEEESYELPHAKLFAYKVSKSPKTLIFQYSLELIYLLIYFFITSLCSLNHSLVHQSGAGDCEHRPGHILSVIKYW